MSAGLIKKELKINFNFITIFIISRLQVAL